MKILHAAESIRGGVATVMQHHLVAQTHRFCADSVRALVPEDQAEDLGDRPFEQLVTFHRTGRNLRSFINFIKAFRKCVREERPDIIHLHSSFAGVLGRLSLLSEVFRSPTVIYCPHGWAFLLDASELKKRLYVLVEQMLLPLANSIICVSEYERRTARNYGLPDRKLQVIYNGVPLPFDDPSAVRRTYPDGPIRLLFVGRLDYAKGFDFLIQAMRELEGENFHLTVIGSAVHDAPVLLTRTNVTYLGWLPPEDITALYLSADLLVVPSRWEAFGLVAVEAALLSVPALAADCCSLPEIVLDHQTGRLFSSRNVSDLVHQLRCTSREEWFRMGQAARLHSQARFTANRMTAATMDLYEKLRRVD